MEDEHADQKRKAQPSEISTSVELKLVTDPNLSLAERVIAFIDSRMDIVEEKPAPQPMRKAG